MKTLVVATEDELTEKVATRLVEEYAGSFRVGLQLRKNGAGYLRSSFRKFAEMAIRQPVLLITDLDRVQCASALIGDWSRRQKLPEKLIFRVAVREVESWLLADHEAMEFLLGTRARLPDRPDDLPDPKQTLLDLASRKAARDVRLDLCQTKDAIASQGLGYNRRLGLLVESKWRPARAERRSDSLRRACSRLQRLAVGRE